MNSGELCIYRVFLFRGSAGFAPQILWEGPWCVLGSLGWTSWGWTQTMGGSEPLPRAGASASHQDHCEAPAVQTSAASPLLGISSQSLFVCAFGLEKVGIPGIHKVHSTGNVCCVPPASGSSKSQGWKGEVDGNYLL